jgi:hypothetical protein
LKKGITLILVVGIAYFAWQKFFNEHPVEPLYEEPYVIVYGRDRCGWTQKYLKDLKNEEVDLIYESVDNQDVCDELHPRMKDAGLDIRRYNLPVIDVNGHFFIRPDLDLILDAYEIEE